MARPIKEGLDYFPLNVNFFDDDKIAFVYARFQEKGESIALKLLCKIYSDKGYYYKWGEDEAMLFAKRVLGDPSKHTLANDVVHELVKRDFFNKDIFNRFKILTSAGIQKRYIKICKDGHRIYEIDEKIKIPDKTEVRSEETGDFFGRNGGFPPDKSTQRKVKENKGNENTFSEFWDLYDKKIDREKCEKKWDKLNELDIEAIFKTVPAYIKATPDKQYRKNPATYLNNHSWKNEIIKISANGNGFKSEYTYKEVAEITGGTFEGFEIKENKKWQKIEK
jgi:hypothetical protein